jgi:hypothetical protein
VLRRGEVVISLACSAVAGLQGLGQTGAVSERATAQLRVIKAVANVLDAPGM